MKQLQVLELEVKCNVQIIFSNIWILCQLVLIYIYL